METGRGSVWRLGEGPGTDMRSFGKVIGDINIGGG